MEYGIRNPTRSAYLQRWLDKQNWCCSDGHRLTAGITSCLFAHVWNYEFSVCVRERSEFAAKRGLDINLRLSGHQSSPINGPRFT